MNHTGSGRLTDSGSRPPSTGATRWRAVRPVALVAFAGFSLYVLLPTLLPMFRSWQSLRTVDRPFAVLCVVLVVASFVSLWALERIALRTTAWFPVVAAELSGNALSHVAPSAAAGGALETSMLVDAGFDPGDVVAALTASTALQWGTTAALPVLALPAVLGGARIDHRLDVAAYLGAALLVALVTLGVAVFAGDTPLTLIGRAVQRLLNATVRRQHPVTGLPERLLATRDGIRTTLGARRRAALTAAVGSTGFEYLALLCALRAVGAEPRPALVLLAYVASELLALLPITPGGLGFVEAGLVGTLVVAGVPSSQALAATLLYRLAGYWLPLPAGAVAYLLFRLFRRHHPKLA